MNQQRLLSIDAIQVLGHPRNQAAKLGERCRIDALGALIVHALRNLQEPVAQPSRLRRQMHPGDALFTPGEPVDVLATPAAAPWMKISEAVEYLRAVAPSRAVPIHQAIIEPNARGIYYGRLTEMTDTDFRVLEPETSTEF